MDYYLDGVRYTHGDGSGKAKTRDLLDGDVQAFTQLREYGNEIRSKTPLWYRG